MTSAAASGFTPMRTCGHPAPPMQRRTALHILNFAAGRASVRCIMGISDVLLLQPHQPIWGARRPDVFVLDRCHQAGIGVILDFVPAHFIPDFYALQQFDGRDYMKVNGWMRVTVSGDRLF